VTRLFSASSRQNKIEHLSLGTPFEIAMKLSLCLVENRLGQLRASWTDVSSLEIVPAELQGREPDFEENGMALWTVKN